MERSAPQPQRYCLSAVDKAIASSNRAGRKIGRRERELIHRLLKGRDAIAKAEGRS